MKYRITLVESDEGWAVWCDDLPGCNSQGDTREEAVENIRIAIREMVDYLREEGLPVPEPEHGTVLHEGVKRVSRLKYKPI